MRCVVRDSRVEDIRRIQEIYDFHVRNGVASFEEETPSTEDMARRRADVIGRGLPYLVAEADGEIVGYSYAAPYRSRSSYRFTLENSVYVDNRLSRRGIGTALLARLIERCETGEFRQMIAVIGDSDNLPSIALHERLGFQRVGTLHAVGFKLGRWLDSVLMQRALGSGDRDLPVETRRGEPAGQLTDIAGHRG